ncbi:MAG: hypothetical protein R2738_02235 [Bacteroides graminisolvens]
MDASLSEKYMENIVLPAMRYHHVTASGFDIVKEVGFMRTASHRKPDSRARLGHPVTFYIR